MNEYYFDFGSGRYCVRHARDIYQIPNLAMYQAHTIVTKNIKGQWVWLKNRYHQDNVLTEKELEEFAVQRLSSVPL